ncbi:SH3 domain-containing protein, partial [bacterium]|nr:SH3 domain-containing protein [bacterium]
KNVGRSAFPNDKAELLAHPQGVRMFENARQCLIEMAAHIRGYEAAARNPSKFCHGFGIFQYDLQFFKTNPGYFLSKKWENLPDCLGMAIRELKEAMRRQGWSSKAVLSADELVHIGIAYNRGRSILSKGFKQGHFDGQSFYGENLHEFLQIARSTPAGPAGENRPKPGEILLPPPEKPMAGGKVYEVEVSSALMLRAGPDKNAEILWRLPAGQLVTRVDGTRKADWFEIETSVNAALVRGFAFSQYLRAVPKAIIVPVITPSEAPASGPQAVFCPRQPGTLTRRTDPAGARSLNESGAPDRRGESAPQRIEELAKIIGWLDVENPLHQRYLPGSGKTFCNIYAHDYCHLAGVYLPRVWWSGSALVRIGAGEDVPPLIGNTIEEQRANDLFRWLKGFGTSFGWREAATLNELQATANLGAVCLIIARRKEDGKSGHVVVVVAESHFDRAVRDTLGKVVNPLQSQAGTRNFNCAKGPREWWRGTRFADSAFWMHA